jgi:hypothetical protein
MDKKRTIEFTIASGASISDSLDLEGKIPVAVIMPAAWTAAVLTFQISMDNSNWYDLHDRYGEITQSVAAEVISVLEPASFLGARYLKVRSGTSGTGVNQAAERSMTLVCSLE